jgi:hypothetical protein
MKVQYVFGRIWLTSASPAFQKTHPIYNSRQQQDLQATWPQKSAVRRGERACYSSNSENAMKIDETAVQSFRHCGIPTQDAHQTGTADTKQSTCYTTIAHERATKRLAPKILHGAAR